jgi:hypothetical protein
MVAQLSYLNGIIGNFVNEISLDKVPFGAFFIFKLADGFD